MSELTAYAALPSIKLALEYFDEGGTALTAGCGCSRIPRLFTSLSLTVIGIEVSARMIERKKPARHRSISADGFA